MSLDRAAEQRFLDGMEAVGFRYSGLTDGFHREATAEQPGVWVTWDQALEAWEAAQAGERLEEVRPASQTMARTLNAADIDQDPN